MAKRLRGETERSWLRHAAQDTKSSDNRRGGGGGGSRTDTAVDDCRSKTIDRSGGDVSI